MRVRRAAAIGAAAIVVLAAIALARCIAGKPPENAGSSASRPAGSNGAGPVLIAPALATHRRSPPGLAGITEAMDLMTNAGMNVFAFVADWDQLEPTPGRFDLVTPLAAPLEKLVARYPKLDGVVLVLKMIDTHHRPIPGDLRERSFADGEVEQRFGRLLDAIAREPAARRLTHILLGNEIDGYLSAHPGELAAFGAFFQRSADRLRRLLPGLRVGTIVTHGSVRERGEILDAVREACDVVVFTYYPVADLVQGNVSKGWQMRPLDVVAGDIDFMARRAQKPFGFSEIGYASSPTNGSSPEAQAEFVSTMARALEPCAKDGRLEIVLYHSLYDYPAGFCQPYAAQQGISGSRELCEFMGSLGLRSWDTGEERPAWRRWIDEAARLRALR